MKAIATIPEDLFYNPAAAISAAWQPQVPVRIRRNTRARNACTLEFDARKAEVVCSVILTICLLFAFAYCVAQFALS